MTAKRLRLTCFYCEERVTVDFYAMRKHETAHDELRRHGWIFGVDRDGEGGVIFDALCTRCGRGVVEQMVSSGAPIDPEAKKGLLKLYPDLFDKGKVAP
jgi:hypothetical protein